jgi:hypothetical protein
MKKVIISIVSILMFISNSYSQSALETEFVKQLNVYRKQHGLGPVKYDAEVSKVALYHSNYLVECSKVNHTAHYDKLPHDEQFDIKDFKELNFDQRAAMSPDKNIWGEIQIQSNGCKKNESISEIVKGIIKTFDGSPKHKEIMLCEDSEKFKNIVGVSIVKKEGKLGPNFDEYTVNIDFGVILF